MASESDDVLSTKPDALGSLSLVEGPDGRKIAYDQQDGSSPGVVYIHGLHSNMDEPPSAALSKYCREKDISYLRFDLSGHGQSSGRLEDATITQWLEDVELVLNSLRSGPLVLVGNALGAWLMFLYTMRNPDRVFGLVGLATAADFTHLLWKNLDKTTKDEIKRLGYYTLKSDGDDGPSVKLSLDLIMDGEKHTILDMPGLEIINSPTWLLHGDMDTLIPKSVQLQLMQKLQCPVELNVIEGGTHWLYRPQDIDHVLQAVDALLYPPVESSNAVEDDD